MNSTISGNAAGTSGGGIYNHNSSLHVVNSTITGNSAGSGGGISNDQGQFDISNTILNAGASGENIFNSGGTVTSLGFDLSSDDGGGYLNGPADQINTDPLLGPLQDNGGPTFTHALLTGSPAITKAAQVAYLLISAISAAPLTCLGSPTPAAGMEAISAHFNSDPFRRAQILTEMGSLITCSLMSALERQPFGICATTALSAAAMDRLFRRDGR